MPLVKLNDGIVKRKNEMAKKIYQYVVARDYGFAPNPFFGVCTLATCKPKIRKAVKVGDFVVGTGSKDKGREDCLIYAMRVKDTMTFNEYWEDDKFRSKKPNLRGSIKQAYGDNIYFQHTNGIWSQADSHHSKKGGSPVQSNIDRDTQTDRILISDDYAYWGKEEYPIPKALKDDEELGDSLSGRGHRCDFSDKTVKSFTVWFDQLSEKGVLGDPSDWE